MAKNNIKPVMDTTKDVMVDVSAAESHSAIQCDDIRLITSTLKPLLANETKNSETRFAFRIRIMVDGKKSFSYLEVKVNYFFDDGPDDLQGYNLSFVLMATFSPGADVPQDAFIEFVKAYTLTILWPYAREYASDQFRRVGNHDIILPIINPQVVTEQIIENDLVKVEIIPQK